MVEPRSQTPFSPRLKFHNASTTLHSCGDGYAFGGARPPIPSVVMTTAIMHMSWLTLAKIVISEMLLELPCERPKVQTLFPSSALYHIVQHLQHGRALFANFSGSVSCWITRKHHFGISADWSLTHWRTSTSPDRCIYESWRHIGKQTRRDKVSTCLVVRSVVYDSCDTHAEPSGHMVFNDVVQWCC